MSGWGGGELAMRGIEFHDIEVERDFACYWNLKDTKVLHKFASLVF